MRKSLLLLFLFWHLIANAQIVINELLAKNVSWNMDESFNFSNWVELHNTSNSTVYNLTDFYLTDDRSNPRKWKPASKTINPKSFALLYFERDQFAGHATFKLSPEGGTLYLFNASLSVVDSVVYPYQLRNISWGRKMEMTSEWVYLDEPSPASSNNNRAFSTVRCSNPYMLLPGGFYTGTQQVVLSCDAGDTIYYTTNYAEPTRSSTRYVSPIVVSATSAIRAKAYKKGKLSSDVVTATYFINQRQPSLPVVSVVTNPAYLYDAKIGIYVNGDGSNGKMGNGASSPMNWNADWDRPVNYEFFDTTRTMRLNQELDIKILGGWTRSSPLKSIAIKPKKKFGNNKLKYEVFGATKPGMKYHDIQMRNSGNDFGYTMMRDAFMQSLVQKRLNLDYQAYEPAVLFINGVYHGIENLRERTNESYMYSNYGLDEDVIYEIEATNLNVNTANDIATDTAFSVLSSFLKNNDLTSGATYQQIRSMLDVDNFASYNICDIFFGNTDWPYNNVKMWRKKAGGPWRWFITDTDFGFSLWDNNLHNHNTLTFALGENQAGIIGGYGVQPEWSTIVLTRLLTNEQFKRKFIDKFAINLSTTFAPARINAILDSLASKISNEIVYHKSKWGSSEALATDVSHMKVFSANRATNMFNFLSARFLNNAAVVSLRLSSNLSSASYTFNSEQIQDANLEMRYFQNRDFTLKANPVSGYKFKHWDQSLNSAVSTLIPMGSNWSYYDGGTLPAVHWNTSAYNDLAWKTGAAQFGYGGKGEVTTIAYGGVSTNKYITSYFRKTVIIDNLANRSNFVLNVLADDGAVVYVNGQELGRSNMPTGIVSNATVTSSANNGVTATFSVPIGLLQEGANLIAVEVHQYNSTTSDCMFNLSLQCEQRVTSTVSTNPTFSGSLSNPIDLKAVYELDPVPPINYTIAINELVSSNNVVSDELGEKDDYIELYNYGSQDIDIAGWYLTDDINVRTKSVLPVLVNGKTILPAQGRLVFWADDQLMQGPMHLNFKLGKEGDTVLLSRPASVPVLVDSVCYPAMNTNLSYSRLPDGGLNWVVQDMTYNSSNSLPAALPNIVKALDVFPTMVTDWFTVRNASGEKLMLFDLTGKCVYQTVCGSNEQFIQGSFLKPGLYLLRIGERTSKIMKR